MSMFSGRIESVRACGSIVIVFLGDHALYFDRRMFGSFAANYPDGFGSTEFESNGSTIWELESSSGWRIGLPS